MESRQYTKYLIHTYEFISSKDLKKYMDWVICNNLINLLSITYRSDVDKDGFEEIDSKSIYHDIKTIYHLTLQNKNTQSIKTYKEISVDRYNKLALSDDVIIKEVTFFHYKYMLMES